LAGGDVVRGDGAFGQLIGFQRRVRSQAHLVEAAAHVELAALRVAQRRVHRHAVAVDRAAGRVGEVQRCRRAVPDAQPRIEPLRVGGPNKPYEVLGQAYEPMRTDQPLRERGLASWYGRKFHGRPTASGETYDMYAMTAAHRTMPIPSYARVRNPANGREVVVRINDRGPFHPERVVDLSYTAALKLGVLGGVDRYRPPVTSMVVPVA
jgi:rare lipoprotein A (peptidoglycan hydrolase)